MGIFQPHKDVQKTASTGHSERKDQVHTVRLGYSVVPLHSAHKPIPCEDSKCFDNQSLHQRILQKGKLTCSFTSNVEHWNGTDISLCGFHVTESDLQQKGFDEI